MDYQLIEKLLDRYFEGNTSLEEEKLLKDFFCQEEIPEHLQAIQPLFTHLREAGQIELGIDFDEKLLQQLSSEEKGARIRYIGRQSVRVWMSRAAAILLIVAASWWYYDAFHEPTTEPTAGIDWSKYEVQSPEEAFELTQMALLKASSELNKGANTAAREVSNLREIGQYLKK